MDPVTPVIGYAGEGMDVVHMSRAATGNHIHPIHLNGYINVTVFASLWPALQRDLREHQTADSVIED
ncbi:hypothetical protein ColLi_05138 [Colletotrichum liriopes]|uniref:Uncharacterized protein n=1 Tax=Colletotrichum liriopes TaxID=708192 RepID=A0AA37LR50_9PEZI|nr:hypothetical protein ColLi_05138 [Colletotrichum liriopes]